MPRLPYVNLHVPVKVMPLLAASFFLVLSCAGFQIRQDIPEGKWTIGPADASVRIVEYSDLTCPYSAINAAALQDLLKRFPGKIRVAFKHFPLPVHLRAKGAHAALLAAGAQGKFWEFRFMAIRAFDLLDDQGILELAREAGLDMERFARDLADRGSALKEINADLVEGRNLGVRGAPGVFINGVKSDRMVRDVETLILGAPVSPEEAGGQCH